MRLYKCKNSVFCVFFLLCFFVGTICGALLFRIFVRLHRVWIEVYCAELFSNEKASYLQLLLSGVRPILLIPIISCFTFGKRIIPFLIMLRGCGVAYLLSAAFCAQCGMFPLILWQFFLLVSFFCVCRVCSINKGDYGQLVIFLLPVPALAALIQYCLL